MSLVRQSLYDVDGGGADVLPHPGRVGEMKWIFLLKITGDVCDAFPIVNDPCR
jgi:hypothetical protein